MQLLLDARTEKAIKRGGTRKRRVTLQAKRRYRDDRTGEQALLKWGRSLPAALEL
jgi:hypothetical protein